MIRFIPFEIYWNGNNYDHKEIGFTGKTVVGYTTEHGFHLIEILK